MGNLSKKSLSLLCILILLASVLTYGCGSSGQTAAPKYPTKPVKVMIPFPAGGLSDVLARTLGDKLSVELGQSFVAENKTSGGNLDAGLDVVKAEDGYAIGVFPPAIAWPEVYRNAFPYTSEDLIPVARIASPGSVVFVKTDSPIDSVQDLVDYFKANPGAKYGQGSTGSNPHLCMYMLAKNENLDAVAVPFNGDAALIAAVLGGHIPVAAGTIPGVIGQLKDGGIKPIAIYAEKRLTQFPDLQTFSEQGFELGLPVPDQTVYVSKNAPAEVVKILDEAIAKVAQDQEFQTKMNNLGLTVSYQNSAACKEQMPKTKEIMANFVNLMGLKK